MSNNRNALVRYGLILLSTAAIAACSSEGDGGTEPGTITLSITPGNATVQQGGSAAVTVTLTRAGAFTGTVQFGVTGQPAGVTGAVTNEVTVGAVTTATVTINVGAAVTPGTYPLVLSGTGTGVTAATANYSLTVTATPAFTLGLSSATVTIAQGASTPTVGVTLVRTNFTGNVVLSVENLPAGVTAAFVPNTTATSASVLTLTVAAGAATGTFTNLLVRATATGLTDRTAPLTLTITAAAGSFTLAVTPAGGVSMAQGTVDASKTITITRTNYTPDVTLTAENLPAGLTAVFAPNPTGTNASVLTLTATAGLAPDVYNLTIRGTGPAALRAPGELVSVEATTTLAVTVTVAGNFTLTTAPATNVGVTQGLSANVTVNVNRTGGNTSAIALTSTGTLPAGMTLAFVPTSTTTNSSVLTVTTTGATPLGATPIVIRGNTTGLAEQTVNLTINVTAPVGTGNTTVSFVGCDPEDKAVWLAFMDGTAGTWTVVPGVADVYVFDITQSKGSFAYVTLATGESHIFVQHMTQAELTAATISFCPAAAPAGETINGTVANLPGGFLANVSFGGATALAFVDGAVQLTGARDGSHHVIAYSRQLAVGAADRIYIDPIAQNPPNLGSLANTVDFLHATNSFSPSTATFNLTGTAGGETMFHGMNFFSGTGPTACTPASLYAGASVVGTSFVGYGVPLAKHPGGGLHQASITAADGTTGFRLLTENFTDIVTRSATPFVLPPALPIPVVTNAGGPYKRVQAVITGQSAEYNVSSALTYVGQTNDGRTGVVSGTAGWLGGTSFTLVLPDFSGLAGFINSWAPTTAEGVDWSLASIGGTIASGCQPAARLVTAARSGTL